MDILGKLLLSSGLIMLVIGCASEKKSTYLDRMSVEHKGDKPVANAATEIGSQIEVKRRSRNLRYD